MIRGTVERAKSVSMYARDVGNLMTLSTLMNEWVYSKFIHTRWKRNVYEEGGKKYNLKLLKFMLAMKEIYHKLNTFHQPL